MSNYARIAADDAYHLMIDNEVTIVDIRDPDSFKAGHITDALHLDDTSIATFIDNANREKPVIVCCYHGNLSQSAGAFLAENGFAEVYSLDGGYAAWSVRYPDDCDSL